MTFFVAVTDRTVLDESIVVSGAGYTMVWGNEDFSHMGRGLRCCMTLCQEFWEVFGAAIIVDVISLLQPLESQLIPILISPFLTRDFKIEEKRLNLGFIFHLQATTQAN